jgi:hypothetical protein
MAKNPEKTDFDSIPRTALNLISASIQNFATAGLPHIFIRASLMGGKKNEQSGQDFRKLSYSLSIYLCTSSTLRNSLKSVLNCPCTGEAGATN